MNIKKLDLFGSPINLLVNKQKIIKTKEGAIFTIFVIICSAICTWLLGNDIFYKEKPDSYSENIVLDRYAPIQWTKEAIPIAFAIQDWNGLNIDYDKYLNLSLVKYHFKTDENGEMNVIDTKYFDLAQCNYSDFPSLAKQNFDDLGFQHALCPGELNITLMGFWSESEFAYLELAIGTCAGKEGCEDMDGIDNFIINNKINLQMYYQDSLVLLNNYTDPIVKKMNSPFSYLQVDTMKNINYFIERDFLHTDEAFFGTSNNKVGFLSIKNQLSDSTDFDPVDGRLLAVDFYSFNISNNVYRKYVKITEISAGVGGIIRFLTIFSFVFHNYYSDVEKKILIMEGLLKESDKKLKSQMFRKSPTISYLKTENSYKDTKSNFIKNYSSPNGIGLHKVSPGTNRLISEGNLNERRLSASSSKKSNYNDNRLVLNSPTRFLKVKRYKINRGVYNNKDIHSFVKSIGCCLRTKIVCFYNSFACRNMRNNSAKLFYKMETKINSSLDINYIITSLNDVKEMKAKLNS